eukprot:TRINITY_DN24667_c0_g1_i1.p1 TRINITY_DN24667_c0_g1~~TRINITY_DN24667_c0_g1_i1.p1  ORF type:complete len:448 (-),score=104.77 TRINITY_DN24667_c0_g1_i1:150-1493(-)
MATSLCHTYAIRRRSSNLHHLGRRWAASSNPGMHQTPIVDLLWRRRAEAKAARTDEAAKPAVPTAERTLTPRKPQESANMVTYYFSQPEMESLKERYRNPWGFMRFGRILEDLDALAGTVAYDHCRSSDPQDLDLHIVTASVDRIKYIKRPDVEADLTMSGVVTWVGRSSMEIRMRAVSGTTEFLDANFTFVARCPTTGKAAKINPLVIEGDGETALFELGEQRDAARKAQRKVAKQSVVGSTLDDEGLAAAHELLDQARPMLAMPTLAPATDIFMKQTSLQNTITTMMQQRNTAGRIFGGFLMRRAFELAMSVAHLFSGRRPILFELDRVTFERPVAVGDLLHFDACVLYTSEAMNPAGRPTVHVEVVAIVMKPEKRQSYVSNKFNFTFGVSAEADGSGGCTEAAKAADVELRRVLPATREEAYRIIERYRGDLLQLEEDKLAAAS